MPDGRGSLFDVLDRAKKRGLDVRVIFWRINDDIGFAGETVFSGTAEHQRMLSERRTDFHIRWDRAHKLYCQHQKSWLIDVAHPSEVVFVGGINLDKPSLVLPGHDHDNDPQTHDIYLELRGLSASDVHHNFEGISCNHGGGHYTDMTPAPGGMNFPFMKANSVSLINI